MLRCISEDFPSHILDSPSDTSPCLRPRITSALLADRRALRVLCAPPLYGKSYAAYEYAGQTFAPEDVRWVDATTPAFLIALDARPSDEFVLRFLDRETDHHKSLLFVFDGCPYLDEPRFEALRGLVVDLMEADHEVLLTTSDRRWLALAAPKVSGIDARALLLDAHEQQDWPHRDIAKSVPAAKKAADRALAARIAGCATADQQPHERFCEALLDHAIHDELEALALVMIVLGSGALHELRAFTDATSSVALAALEHHHPHAGITALEPMFAALELPDRDRFRLVRQHLSALAAALSRFESEEELVEALVTHLLAHDDVSLATQIVCGLHDDAARERFLSERARDFLFTCQPALLLHIARTLPREFFTHEHRWMLVALALGMLGEGELAVRVMRAFRSSDPTALDEATCARQGAPSYKLPEEASVLLMKTMLDVAERSDLMALHACISTLRAQRAVNVADATSARPDLARDMIVLLDEALTDPFRGIASLLRFASSGHALGETLVATCAFMSVLSNLARQRTDGRAPEGSRGLFAAVDLAPDRRTLVEQLEQHVIHILARQVALFPPNHCALALFERARQLFGERAYVLVDDRTLAHLEAARTSLVSQRRAWRADRAVTLSFEGDRDEAAATLVDPEQKKLRINTLGRFEIEAHDPRITIKDKVRKQVRLLISLIAMNDGREVARPWVQRVMWPDSPERNAKQNLYTMWSLLNKSVLDADGTCPFFESYPHSLALNESLVETDTQLLNDLCKQLRSRSFDIPVYERAIDRIEELYRGPLLPGEETAEVVANRKKYQERLIEALLASGQHLRRRGETALSLRYFRFAFDNEPTREDVCYQLMLSLWKLGRHGEALNEYFVCRRALIERFGIEGTPKLRELYEAILADAS